MSKDLLLATPEILPNPDPSVVTLQAIDRTVCNATAIINARVNGIEKAIDVFQSDLTRVPTSVDRAIVGLREIMETRFTCIDHDTQGMQAIINAAIEKREENIKAQVTHLHDLMVSKIDELAAVTTERFLGVAAQFSERDTRTDQRAMDTKLAVDAAFAAAKENTGKIETGLTKQIDAIISIIDTKTSNLASGLSDLKERLTAMESRTQGMSAANMNSRNNQNDNRAWVLGFAGILASIVAISISVLK